MMPVADFPGAFGWGYDGVNLFAPTRLYGTPDDLRALRRSRARARPRRDPRRRLQPPRPGRQLPARLLAATTSPTATRTSGATRSTSRARAAGARVLRRERRATGSTSSTSTACASTRRRTSTTPRPSTSSREIAPPRARGRAARARSSSSPRTSRRTRALVRAAERGGYGLDALWNDDFHHTRVVALTGRREAYYTDYHGHAAGAACRRAKYGYLYQGQWYSLAEAARAARRRSICRRTRSCTSSRTTIRWRTRARQAPAPAARRPARYRALTALTAARAGDADAVPGPGVRGLARRSSIFADHKPELRQRGPRRAASSSSRSFRALTRSGDRSAMLPVPDDARRPSSAASSTGASASAHAEAYALHRDLLRAAARRSGDRARGAHRRRRRRGARSRRRSLLRYRRRRRTDDRLLVVNLGRDLDLAPVPEPLLAPPPGAHGRCCGRARRRATAASGTAPLDPRRRVADCPASSGAVAACPSPMTRVDDADCRAGATGDRRHGRRRASVCRGASGW